MDFGKPFIKETNVITESGIRLLPIPPDDNDNSHHHHHEDDDTNNNSVTTTTTQTSDKEDDDDDDVKKKKRHINRMLIQSANQAATELFLSTGSKLQSTFQKKKKKTLTIPSSSTTATATATDDDDDDDNNKARLDLVNCSLYHSLLLPPTPVISAGSLVVVFESFDSLNFVYAQPRSIFNNRNGHFHHDDFIGKPYGCKIRSRNNRGLGFVYLLKPTPELWARSLNHRTQIVHELDASMVVFEMGLKPNMVVCESGTGSGAMTHAMLRAVSPGGMVHTYEFNEMRVKAAREDFRSNGLGHLVRVHWRDVCGKTTTTTTTATTTAVDKGAHSTPSITGDESQEKQPQQPKETMGSGGFDIGNSIAHAIFLDLPEPWLAIPHAAETLRPNGSIASYSPCVEQSQKTVQKMKECGFHSVRTLEVRLREHYMDEVTLETVPTKRLPREPNVNPFIPGVSVMQPPQTKTTTTNNNNNETPKEKEKEEEESRTNGKNSSETNASTTDTSKNDEKETTKKQTKGNTNDVVVNEPEEEEEEEADTNKTSSFSSKKRKLLCARPFTSIRGHTAFLTFATNGNKAFYAKSKQ